MEHRTRFRHVEISEGNTRVEVHAPEASSTVQFTTVTNDPTAFDSDVLRSAVVVAGMLTGYGSDGAVAPECVATAIPGDTARNVGLVTEMRDEGYAPLAGDGLGSLAGEGGLVTLSGDDASAALAYFEFLGMFGIDVTAVPE